MAAGHTSRTTFLIRMFCCMTPIRFIDSRTTMSGSRSMCLSELDNFKNEQTERGANARTVHRFLSRCFHQNSKLVMHGAKTPEGGTIRIAINEFLTAERMSKELRRFQQIFQDLDNPDNRILALCLYVKSKRTERTILVTKDLNMQLKALAIGLEAQDYENDKVEVADVEGYGQRTIEIDPHTLQRFASSRELTLKTKETEGLHLNEYVFLSAGDNKFMAARHAGSRTLSATESAQCAHQSARTAFEAAEPWPAVPSRRFARSRYRLGHLLRSGRNRKNPSCRGCWAAPFLVPYF